MKYSPNPIWADYVLEKINPLIEEKLGRDFAIDERRIVKKGAGRAEQWKFEEYGCGYFGCVFPTNTKNMVLKLTTDRSELAIPLATQFKIPERMGQIKYYFVLDPEFELDEGWESCGFNHGKVYLVWRDEVCSTGFLYNKKHEMASRLASGNENVRKFMAREFGEFNEIILNYNSDIRILHKNYMEKLNKRKAIIDKTEEKELFDRALFLLFELASNEIGVAIAEALYGYVADYGILITDIHLGNIALVGNYDEEETDLCASLYVKEQIADPSSYVLFDTGMAVPTEKSAEKYFKKKVPRLTDLKLKKAGKR